MSYVRPLSRSPQNLSLHALSSAVKCLESLLCLHSGFWRHEQKALLASYHSSIKQLDFKLSRHSSAFHSSHKASVLGNSPEDISGVALLDSEGGDAGLLAFGLARHMLESGRLVSEAMPMYTVQCVQHLHCT